MPAVARLKSTTSSRFGIPQPLPSHPHFCTQMPKLSMARERQYNANSIRRDFFSIKTESPTGNCGGGTETMDAAWVRSEGISE